MKRHLAADTAITTIKRHRVDAVSGPWHERLVQDARGVVRSLLDPYSQWQLAQCSKADHAEGKRTYAPALQQATTRIRAHVAYACTEERMKLVLALAFGHYHHLRRLHAKRTNSFILRTAALFDRVDLYIRHDPEFADHHMLGVVPLLAATYGNLAIFLHVWNHQRPGEITIKRSLMAATKAGQLGFLQGVVTHTNLALGRGHLAHVACARGHVDLLRYLMLDHGGVIRSTTCGDAHSSTSSLAHVKCLEFLHSIGKLRVRFSRSIARCCIRQRHEHCTKFYLRLRPAYLDIFIDAAIVPEDFPRGLAWIAEATSMRAVFNPSVMERCMRNHAARCVRFLCDHGVRLSAATIWSLACELIPGMPAPPTIDAVLDTGHGLVIPAAIDYNGLSSDDQSSSSSSSSSDSDT
jgi:hypothetical protein